MVRYLLLKNRLRPKGPGLREVRLRGTHNCAGLSGPTPPVTPPHPTPRTLLPQPGPRQQNREEQNRRQRATDLGKAGQLGPGL